MTKLTLCLYCQMASHGYGDRGCYDMPEEKPNDTLKNAIKKGVSKRRMKEGYMTYSII